MVNAGFENVIITAMTSWIDEEDENQFKVEVTLYAQFTTAISNDTYSEFWEALLETDNYLKSNVVSGLKVAFPLKCPDLKGMKKAMPPEIWMASALNESSAYKVGDLIHLQCPNGWKISKDNDTFDEWDDLYTVACLNLASPIYNAPLYWPSCRKACTVCLPDPPAYSGLVAIKPPNSIPIGQYGSYKCLDATLGVDSVNF